MESIPNPLREADRAAAMPFLNPPATPWWYPLMMAAYFTTVSGAAAILREHQAIGLTMLVVPIAAVLLFVRHYRRRWGTWPRLEKAPAEIRRAYAWFLGACAVDIVICGLVWVFAGAPVALPVIFVTSLIIFWLYERRVYPKAAAKARERLA